MRCIEIFEMAPCEPEAFLININMRCIEIAGVLRTGCPGDKD